MDGGKVAVERMSNAVIVEQRGYAYLNIPKSACTSVKMAICQQHGHDAQWLRHESGLWHPFRHLLHCSNLYRFTVVRHPAARLVSCWIETRHPRDRILELNRGLKVKAGLDFRAFVYSVAAEDDWRANDHYVQQSHLCLYRGISLIDEWFRLEDIATAWPQVQAKTGLGPLPHERKSEHESWQWYYSDELRRVVETRYVDDFREFGYEW